MKRCMSLLLVLLLIYGCSSDKSKRKYVSTLEGKKIEVASVIGGKITELNIEEGDRVEKDEIIGCLDTANLHLKYKSLQANIDKAKSGIQLAREKLQIALQDKDHLKSKYERIKNLYEDDNVSEQRYDDIKNAYKKSANSVSINRINIKKLASSLEKAKVQRRIVKEKIGDALVESPVDGLVNEIYYEEGEVAPPSRPIAEVMNTKKLEINIYLPVEELPKVEVGDEVKVKVDGITRSFTGRISHISNKSEFTPQEILTPETRSSLVYEVLITVRNEEGILKDGMPAEVIL